MDDRDPRVDALLATLPEPDGVVSDRARARALAAVPARRPARRIAAIAGLTVAAAAGGAAVATVGTLALRDTPQPAVVQGAISLPEDLAGVAVTIDGRAWTRTKDGFAIERLHADTVELSPNAQFLAAGVGSSLVALTPTRATAWRHPTAGRVATIRWAPNPEPIYVAYVVRQGARNELRVIEGDGDHDRRVAADVTPASPVWNPNPLEVWYEDRTGVWRTYSPATGRRGVTKSAEPGSSRDEAAVARARSAAGHGDWAASATLPVRERGTLVAIGPVAPSHMPLEVWWVPDGRPTLVLRATTRPGAPVTLAARPR